MVPSAKTEKFMSVFFNVVAESLEIKWNHSFNKKKSFYISTEGDGICMFVIEIFHKPAVHVYPSRCWMTSRRETPFSSKSSSLMVMPISNGALICYKQRKDCQSTENIGYSVVVVSTYCKMVVLSGFIRLCHDLTANPGGLGPVLC